MQKTVGSLGIGLCVVLAMACGSSNNREPSTAGTPPPPAPTATVPTGMSPPMAQVTENAEAVTEIARARCERETACNNVGQGKDFDTGTTCMKELAYNVQGELRPEDCPNVRKTELDQCVQEIRGVACANMIDSIERVATCKKAQLCMR